MLTSGTVYSRAAILGAVTGMRSLLPFALLSVAARRRDTPAPFAARAGGPLGLLRSRGARLGWGLAAARL
jgi:hypothetical protein